MPLVSVVIPTHNRCQLLPTAVQSVLNQTFQDFELLVVDDGSTDGTERIRDAFHDPRIRWLRHASPRGGGAARNTGIREAQGELIAFLDDDDEWYPQKLGLQVDLMLKSPGNVGAIYTGYVVVERATGQMRGRMTPKLRGDLHAQLFRNNPIGGTSSVLLRKTSLERVNGFDERLPSFQDRDLWIRISREFHFDYIPDPLLTYYVHDKKIWTDLTALERGLEIMRRKYGSSVEFRKWCGNRYLEIAIRSCEAGEMNRSRKLFLNAIGLYPWEMRSYLYYGLSLFGSSVFVKVRQGQRRFSTVS